jgi:hypothetical protein
MPMTDTSRGPDGVISTLPGRLRARNVARVQGYGQTPTLLLFASAIILAGFAARQSFASVASLDIRLLPKMLRLPQA